MAKNTIRVVINLLGLLLLLWFTSCQEKTDTSLEAKLLGKWEMEFRECLGVRLYPPWEVTMEFISKKEVIVHTVGLVFEYTYYTREDHLGRKFIVMYDQSDAYQYEIIFLEPSFLVLELDSGCTDKFNRVN